MTSYSFPPLKFEEIGKCLNELGITASKEELTNPANDKEFYRRVLESLTEICSGVPKDEASQAAFAGLQQISYPELHEDSVPMINLFRAESKMMEMCEIPDFTIKDLMNPTVSRCRRQLSGIVNFAKFREERLLLLSDLSATRESLLEHYEQLKEKNENLSNRNNSLQEQNSAEGQIIDNLEQDCKNIEQEMSSLNTQQEKLKIETVELKDLNSELKEGITKKSEELKELIAKRKKLETQIVSSPEKFRQQITHVGQLLQDEQKESRNADRRSRELSAWVCNLEEAQEDVNLALESLKNVRNEVEKQKVVRSEIESQKQLTAASREGLSELQQLVQQQQRNAARAEEKLLHLRKQSNSRNKETQSTIALLHQQLIDAEKFRLQVRTRVEQQDDECDRLEKESEVECQNQQQEIASITSAYHRLENVVMSHLRELQKACTIENGNDVGNNQSAFKRKPLFAA